MRCWRPACYAVDQEKPCSIFQIVLMVVKNLCVGGKVSIALAKSKELCVASTLNYHSWSHFCLLWMSLIICNLYNPCLGLLVIPCGYTRFVLLL
jgi:hypothetical protein